MTSCFVGRKEGRKRITGAKTPVEEGGRAAGRRRWAPQAAPGPPGPVGKAAIVRSSADLPAGNGRHAAELRWDATQNCPHPSPCPTPAAWKCPETGSQARPKLLHPRPPDLAGGRGPQRAAGWVRGRLYQARIPCNVEMPALPCAMGVCTEFKSPTLKFIKLLPAAEGCMVCMDG